MYEQLKQHIDGIKEPHLHRLAEMVFVDDTEIVKEFQQHSAAKSVHHGFIGGLLQHTLGVTKMCEYFAQNYEILDHDLLITAAMFHDIGSYMNCLTFRRMNTQMKVSFWDTFSWVLS